MKFILFNLLTCFCFGSDLLKDMTLEEKVGQLLMVHFNGSIVNDEAKFLVQEVKVGSVIYYNWSNDLSSPLQVASLSKGLQELAKKNQRPIPLLIAADQEGGVVTRLQDGFTIFAGNRALAETFDPNLAKLSAFTMGEELKAVGINMNLAPVVDVNSNPKNPVIGVRSFGNDPKTVIAFGRCALEGFKQAQMIATLKHFPGYGDVSVDPHEALPKILKSKKELKEVELLPFAELAASCDAIMTAHILVPAFDAENCSTLSENTLNYLRNEIGFDGVIVADSLVMDGVLDKCKSVDEAAINAINAGCDILILGGKLLVGERLGFELNRFDVQRIHNAIVQAVKSSRISYDKLNRSVERILKLKNRYLVSEMQNTESVNLEDKIFTPKHQALSKKIASLALKTKEGMGHKIGNLGDKKIFIVGSKILETIIENSSLLKIGKSTSSYFFNTLSPSLIEMEDIKKQAIDSDVLIVCSYNAWKNPSAIALTQSLRELKKPLIILSLRDPLDSSLFANADLVFTSFSPSKPSIEAICDKLTKEYK